MIIDLTLPRLLIQIKKQVFDLIPQNKSKKVLARKARARPIGRFLYFNNGEATTVSVANPMAATAYTLNVLSAHCFAPKEENWSETVNIKFTEEVDGYIVDEQKGKVLTKVKNLSFFIGDVIKGLCAASDDVAAFLAAKSRDEKIRLVPMLLSASVMDIDIEILNDENKAIHTITSIVVNDAMQKRIEKALDQLFGF